MEFTLGLMAAYASAILAVIAVSSVISAPTLQWATTESIKYTPTFGVAYAASFAAGLIAAVVCFGYGFAVGLFGKDLAASDYLTLVAIGFFRKRLGAFSRPYSPGQGANRTGSSVLANYATNLLRAVVR